MKTVQPARKAALGILQGASPKKSLSLPQRMPARLKTK